MPLTATAIRSMEDKIRGDFSACRELLWLLWLDRAWITRHFQTWIGYLESVFDHSSRQLYRIWEALKVEKESPGICQNGKIPDSHLSELSHLPPELRQEVLSKTKEENGRVTALTLRDAVSQRLDQMDGIPQTATANGRGRPRGRTRSTRAEKLAQAIGLLRRAAQIMAGFGKTANYAVDAIRNAENLVTSLDNVKR